MDLVHQNFRLLHGLTPTRPLLYPPTHAQFVINIYYDQAQGKQVCTCCRVCEGWRYVPGAQIFAQCSAGDGSNSVVGFKSRVSHQKRGVAPGKVVHYRATIENLDKTSVVSALAVEVQLPAATNATYSGSTSSKGYAIVSKGGKVRFRTTKGLTPMIVNSTATPPTVTWTDLVLPPRKSMRFSVSVRVNTWTPKGTPLLFRGRIYQQLPANGLPYCDTTYVNQTVFVK